MKIEHNHSLEIYSTSSQLVSLSLNAKVALLLRVVFAIVAALFELVSLSLSHANVLREPLVAGAAVRMRLGGGAAVQRRARVPPGAGRPHDDEHGVFGRDAHSQMLPLRALLARAHHRFGVAARAARVPARQPQRVLGRRGH